MSFTFSGDYLQVKRKCHIECCYIMFFHILIIYNLERRCHMKIRINFTAKDKRFPLSYRMMITSLIKNALEKSDKEYFKHIYYYEEKKNKKVKPFTFSVFFKDYEIEKDIVYINGNGSVLVSTCDYNFGINLYNGLLKSKSYNYKKGDDGFSILITNIILEREKDINESRVFCKTLSPIHIRDRNNKPLSLDDENFNKELNYMCNLSLDTFRGEGLKEEIIFTPVKMKKVVAKEKIADFMKINKEKCIYIQGYSGTFYLEGNIQDLKMLMQIGIGFRRSEGFGMIDIV